MEAWIVGLRPSLLIEVCGVAVLPKLSVVLRKAVERKNANNHVIVPLEVSSGKAVPGSI